MKKTLLALTIALSANIATADELTEFKSGDIATAASFNNNFKIVQDATTANLAEINALKELLATLQSNGDNNTTTLAEIQAALETLETTVNANSTMLDALENSSSNDFDYKLVNENNEKVLDVISLGSDGTLLVTDNSIHFSLNAEGIEIKEGFSPSQYLDSACIQPAMEIHGFNYVSIYGSYVTYFDGSSSLYGLTTESVKLIDGNTYYRLSNYDDEGTRYETEQCFASVYNSRNEVGSHAYSMHSIAIPEYMEIKTSDGSTGVKLKEELSIQKQ
jgi:hypothetical protein